MRRRPFMLALLAAGCTSLPDDLAPIEAQLIDLLPSGLGLMSQRLDVRLSLLNPNRVDLSTTGMRFDIALDGVPFATATRDEGVNLEALRATPVTAFAQVGTGDLIERARRAPADGGLAYTIDGLAFVGRAREVPIVGRSTLRLPTFGG